ncbi:hypothetical protein [Streptomyces virginiae]|uniref:hypothetical protein n=1 Tax=Streptomyces virginiae TaxID=1961 RepID=UPI0022595AC0|nr:hypothetical protein [Streptomyces virginiae]MCX5174357.1 hypothetical protein [Streptomyces virginiae]
MLERKPLKGKTQVTFVLPENSPEGPVSVVGDFNHWNPAAHPLEPRGDGTRAANVSLSANSSHSFRYLWPATLRPGCSRKPRHLRTCRSEALT